MNTVLGQWIPHTLQGKLVTMQCNHRVREMLLFGRYRTQWKTHALFMLECYFAEMCASPRAVLLKKSYRHSKPVSDYQERIGK